MIDLKTFRTETRAWLDANCPATMRGPIKGFEGLYWGGRNGAFISDDQKLWFGRMLAKGWTVPDWAVEYGGAGLSRGEEQILRQEMKRIEAPIPLASFGIWMLGPALLKFGSQGQKRQYLPQIARGEIRWCQGYSEPAAGSDLASLATKCEDKGDHYLVNGQKVWTSYADKADWVFCLVRTDNTGSKHQGISFLLFDMQSEGVEAKPIQLISGKSPFCETFFTNVKVPKGNIVGDIGQGWTIAKYLLTHEREMIGDARFEYTASQMAIDAIGLENGVLPDPILRADIAKWEIDNWAFEQTIARKLSEAKAGASLGADSSMLKYYGSELNKRLLELVMDSTGYTGLEWESPRSDNGFFARNWLRTKGNSIEGGTSEIQLNIIAKHILKLPGA